MVRLARVIAYDARHMAGMGQSLNIARWSMAAAGT
jgi:hypothetical protein